jgi:hypothetical protein
MSLSIFIKAMLEVNNKLSKDSIKERIKKKKKGTKGNRKKDTEAERMSGTNTEERKKERKGKRFIRILKQ